MGYLRFWQWHDREEGTEEITARGVLAFLETYFQIKTGCQERLFFSRLPLKEFKIIIIFFFSKKIKSGTKDSNGTRQHINHTTP